MSREEDTMPLKQIVRTIDSISTWVGRIASYLIYFLTAVLCYEIFARGIFNAPTIWAHETAAYFFGAYFMLGGAYTLKEGGHINVDIIFSKFSAKNKAVIDVITSVLVFLFLFVLTWFATGLLITQIGRNEMSQTVFAPPVFPLSLFIVVGSILFLLQAIAKLIRDVVLITRGIELEEGPEVVAVREKELA
jgi:TRAP-type mannitol/chloroaromatic compound transport system permease small subunit